MFFRNRDIKIHYSTKIGYGFYIGHGGSVVINLTEIIGNNVSVLQFTSIRSSEGVSVEISNNFSINLTNHLNRKNPVHLRSEVKEINGL